MWCIVSYAGNVGNPKLNPATLTARSWNSIALDRSTRKASFWAGGHQAGCASTAAMGGRAPLACASIAATRLAASGPAACSPSSEKRPCSDGVEGCEALVSGHAGSGGGPALLPCGCGLHLSAAVRVTALWHQSGTPRPPHGRQDMWSTGQDGSSRRGRKAGCVCRAPPPQGGWNTHLQDVHVALVAGAKGVLPARQAVVQQQAVGEDVHGAGLAGGAPRPAHQLLVRLPPLAAACTAVDCSMSPAEATCIFYCELHIHVKGVGLP